MDEVSGRQAGVLSAQGVAELLAREFTQMAGKDSPNVIEDAWHCGCRIRRAGPSRALRHAHSAR